MFTMFATDAFYPNLMWPLTEWVQAFKNRETDIQLTDDEISMILGGIAQKVLNLYNGPGYFLEGGFSWEIF